MASSVQDLITKTCDEIAEMLLSKNEAYGNSALDPVRIFSKVGCVEQLKVRIDDKLSRLSRGSNAGEDVIRDLAGYLVLLMIAQKVDCSTAENQSRDQDDYVEVSQ
jgi:hypothetical protein